MKKKKTKAGVSKVIWITVVIVGLIIAGVIGYMIPKPVEIKPPILVGYASALTGSAAVYGEYYLKGLQVWVDEVNEAGGLLGGREIKLIVQDTECKPDVAVTVVRKMILEQGIKILIGPYASSENYATQEWVAGQDVLNILYGAWMPDLAYIAKEKGFKLWFRTCVDNELIAKANVKLLKDMGGRRFAQVATDDAWGHGSVDATKKIVAELGCENIAEEYFDRGQTDFYPLLRRIEAANPDTLIISMEFEESKVFFPQLRELGLHEKMRIFNAVDMSDLLPDYAGAIDGAYWAAYFDARWPPNDKAKWFIDAFKARFGATPICYNVDGYIAGFVVSEGIKKAGTDDPREIAKAMEGLTFTTPFGDLKFDEYHKFNVPMFLVQVKNGVVNKV